MIFFKEAILLLSFAFFSQHVLAQSVGVGTTSPNNNAALHVVSTNNNQGLLIPSMTTEQRTSEAFTNDLSPQENGLVVFDLTVNRFYFWIDENWVPIWSGEVSQVLETGLGLAINEQNQIVNIGDTDSTNDITTSTIAGGVLSGNYPNPQLAEGAVETNNLADLAVTGVKVADNTVGVEKLTGLADPTGGRNSLLITNNSNIPRWFQPSLNQVIVTDNAGQITSRPVGTFDQTALPEGHIFVGDAASEAETVNAATEGRILVGTGTTLLSVPVTGDIDLDGFGVVQISPGAIGTAEVLDGSITLDDLASSSVNSDRIADGAIVNTDINSGAGIVVSKFEALNTGEIIFGNAGVPTVGTLSGDASIDAGGNLTLNTLAAIDVDGGAIDNTVIGSVIPLAGSFTSIEATDGSAIANLNASNLASGTLDATLLPDGGAGAGTYGGAGNFVESVTLDNVGRVTNVTTNTATPSDIRLKEGITQLAYSSEQLHQLQAYNYRWKNRKMGEERQIGMLAQEVEKIYPELVRERSDGYKGIVYQGFIPLLLEATKDQQNVIDSLSDSNILLEKRVLHLEKKLQQYEDQLRRLETAIQKVIPDKLPAVAHPETQ